MLNDDRAKYNKLKAGKNGTMQSSPTRAINRPAGNDTLTTLPKPTLRFYLLGPLRIERNGTAIHLPRRKVESLLAYLLLHPEPQSRDLLATLFWGDSSDVQARHSLRTALATVRKEVAPDLLLADRDYIQLNPAFVCWVDLYELLTLTDQLEQSSSDALWAKLPRWQGDLLADCYDEWVLRDREYYRGRLLTLFLQVTQALRARSEYGQAIRVAQQLLSFDPANEHAHQHLIFCYMAAGDRPAALRQYELCAQALRAELDVPPLPETTALYRWIKQNRAETLAASAQITNLPIPLTSFVGRTQETAAVKRLLSDCTGCRRLLTLTGAGGSGKTRLAIQVATDLIDHFIHGVWWVELAALTTGEQVADAVAKALGVREVLHEPCWQSVADFLADKQLLLIIDNCEHLIEASAQLVVHLLSSCPNLQILTTSREGLNIAGETIWQVPTLTLPDPKVMVLTDLLLRFECMRLFVERASAVQPGFSLTLANAPAILEICTQLDGIPLAIELAAARVKVLPVEQIATYLKGAIGARFALLTQGSRSGLPRQQTLRAAIDWSYALLTDDEQSIFHQVAVFRGGFTLTAVEQVVSSEDETQTKHNVLDLLSQLVDKSLVIVEPQDGEHRYRLLETLREYALAQFPTSAELARLQHRHATYCLQVAEQAVSEANGPQQQRWLNRAEIEHANLRAALDYLITHGNGEGALRLAIGIYHFWEVRGYISEGRKWLQLALTQRQGATAITQARALNAAGWLAYGQSDLAQARALYEESLALFTAIGEQVGVAEALQNLALVEMEQGEYATAQQRLEQSLTLCHTLNHRYRLARGLRYLGAVAWDQGRIAAAQAYYHESLSIHQQIGGQANIASGYLKVGDTERVLGNLAAARTNYELSLQIGRSLNYTWLIGNALKGLGLVAFAQGAYAQARNHSEAALTIFRKLGDKSLIGFALSTLGAVAQALGEPQQALTYYSQNLQIMHEVGYKLSIIAALEDLARILTATGQQGEVAARLFGTAAALRQLTGIPVAPTQHEEYAQTLALLRQQLGDDHFAGLWQVGGITPLAQIVATATTLILK